MVTQVHRTRPFVDNRTGALTQWGWYVLNQLRTVAGDAELTPSEALLFTIFGPGSVTPSITAGAILSTDVGPVFVDTIGPDDLGPA